MVNNSKFSNIKIALRRVQKKDSNLDSLLH